MINTSAQEKIEFSREVNTLAITVALISWAMLFASLFLAYAIFRFSATSWPPAGFQKISLFWPTVSLIVTLASSCSFYFCMKSFLNLDRKNFTLYLWITIFLGILFFISQSKLWSMLKSIGLYVEAGVFASILHGFTWIHAGHLLLGFLGLLFLIPITMYQPAEWNKYYNRMISIGRFWHFMTVVWIIMYITLFLI